MARAHQILNAPHIFGMEFGFNLPAFLIAMLITTILVVGIKESAKFNTGIVILKVSVVLFVLIFGMHYVHPANWGHDWHSFAPMGFAGIGAAAGYIFFAYIGFDAVSTTAQEAKNPQRDLPIGIIASLTICTVLYIGMAAVLTGMVPWQLINIGAPITYAFLDHNIWLGFQHHHLRRAGRPHFRDAGHAASGRPAFSTRWPPTACCPKSFSAPSIPSSTRPGRTPFWLVCWPPASAPSRPST
jgi:putative Ca2+/H+ antiporter (TMEM165/GDT1 family)